MQNHRVNVSGGSDAFQYAVMFGYLDQEGILKCTDYNKADFRANLDSYFLNKNLRVSTRLAGNLGNKTQPTDLWSTIWYSTNAPIYPVKNTAGQWVALNGERNYLGEAMEGSTTKQKRHTIRPSFTGYHAGHPAALNLHAASSAVRFFIMRGYRKRARFPNSEGARVRRPRTKFPCVSAAAARYFLR